MGYHVKMKENSTGIIKTIFMDLDWLPSVYWWTEGNYGCDCNREMVFKDDHDIETNCSHDRYTAIEAILDNGEIVALD